MLPEDILARTDWTALEHACAGMTDVPKTPQILASLLSDDARVQADALGDLFGVVHHQDTIYSATPAAVEFVAAVLDHPRTGTLVRPVFGSSAPAQPLRASLLDWLTSVMTAAAESDRWGPSGGEAEVAACRAARPRAYRAASAQLADPDPTVVSAAIGTVACLLDAPDLQHHRPQVAIRLHGHALSASDRRTRIMAVLTLSAWGFDTLRMLREDSDLVVRAAAALSPAHATDPKGTRALLDLVASPADAAWCQQVFPYFGRIFPFKLLPAVIARADLDELVTALAVMLADPPNGTCAGGWGPQLRARVFPDGKPAEGMATAAQRTLQDLFSEQCFGPTARPIIFATDVRAAFSDLVPHRHERAADQEPRVPHLSRAGRRVGPAAPPAPGSRIRAS
ncbi:hypothetical protein [Virgisporangium aliadipatigenens]|uniref:hypothetical protein n=1 Tax=Virgisporangium aliadipatigenens TaxID=741659 RepID=UPI0019425375|nr:hypothetical protein [Virgisporangium aliadipatigenens]